MRHLLANLHLHPKEESSQFQAGPFLEQFVGPRLPPFLVAAEMTEVWTFLASCLPTPLNFCQKREKMQSNTKRTSKLFFLSTF